jgi:hypothetical protein
LSRDQFELAVKFFTAGRKNEMGGLPFHKSTNSGSPMFFPPLTDPAAWGAGLLGSPPPAFKGAEGMTIFLVPVVMWSDGTAASAGKH